MDWTSSLGGVGGRGRASTHATKKMILSFFWGRDRGGPGRRRQRRELGGGREVEG